MLLFLLWIFKPVIISYFTEDTYISNTDYETPINDESVEYHSRYEKQISRHKSDKNINKVNLERNLLPSFRCDGREHCSQMHSYEEAKYFITHCPNTKMDGDNDGIPCERQFRRYD